MDEKQIREDIESKKNVKREDDDCTYSISYILDGSLIKVSFSGPPGKREKLEQKFIEILGPPFQSVTLLDIDFFSWFVVLPLLTVRRSIKIISTWVVLS